MANGINILLGDAVGNNIASPDGGDNIQPTQDNEAAMNRPILWWAGWSGADNNNF